ncbi:hypothetical protein EGH23_25670 [Halomicroarcula sp. F27]|uniref:Uncharacterized protein n=1 Tax=Haloarcula nitratireducens TaxID=2487749 RepID=A0AAW4PIK3_9EURY|nr:hypothetical protein [Halomicroarcula nitratireducens]MBX0298251.1 hypothetical protein [Halomicroarcula nitratireducens]
MFEMERQTTCLALRTISDPARTNALSITYTNSPRTRLALAKRYGVQPPADSVILYVSADSYVMNTDSGDQADAAVTIRHLDSPADLTSLGTRITAQLDTWTETTSERQIVVCFDSVTVLLQYISVAQAGRFLDVVTNLFAEHDAIAHFHLDPEAHTEQTLNKLRPFFDLVVDCRENSRHIDCATGNL